MLIDQFYINLKNKNFEYYKKYLQKHDFLDNLRNIKHMLCCTIQHFQNTMYSPNIVYKLIIFIIAMPNIVF